MGLFPSHTWFLDSGASFHVTPHRKWFTYSEAKSLGKVRLGDSHQCDVVGIGEISIHFGDDSQLTMKNVCHAPQLTCRLMSVGQLDDNGCNLTWRPRPHVTKWHGMLSQCSCLPRLSFSDFELCKHCQHGKQTKNTHNTHVDSSTRPLDLVSMDVCGPMPSRSLDGVLHFTTFIDDATKKVWVCPIKGKYNVFPTVKKWLASTKLEKGHKTRSFTFEQWR